MTDSKAGAVVRQVISRNDPALLDEWIRELFARTKGGGRIAEAELRAQATQLLRALSASAASGQDLRLNDESFETVRGLLGDVSRSRALQGFSPTDTANFVMSLKKPLVTRLGKESFASQQELIEATEELTHLLDQLALFTTEVFQKSREDIMMRQQQEIAELSTPVVKLWDGILALPLIGTLDSARTQVVMETLLQAIVDQSAAIAIIDITGVPTVDTLVAQHLLKTVSAARLMGADCIISGIRPQIAQTMIHLGVELNVASKASLADAFALALKQTNRTVVRVREARMREPS
jgi:rsbT co-antagonist protein RsbR